LVANAAASNFISEPLAAPKSAFGQKFPWEPLLNLTSFLAKSTRETKMLIKLAAAGAAAYGLYRLITNRGQDAVVQPAGGPRSLGLVDPGAPTTVPNTPVGQGGPYVPPT
jgi:hypothetical protein